MGFAQLALPLRLSTMSIEGGAQRIGVGCLLTAFVLHTNKQLIIVANVLIVSAHNQIIVGCLRRSALQLGGTWIPRPECDSRQACDVRTAPTCESVLGAGRTRRRVPNSEQLVVKRHRCGTDVV